MTFAGLPSVDRLVRSGDGADLPHALRVSVARSVVDAARQRARHGAEPGDVSQQYAEALARLRRGLLRPLINATGVLLHTNLGRAPTDGIAPHGFSNLEYDLDAGARGSRHRHAASLAALACGAEDAVVVNNNAAAVLLGLATLAAGREVLVSRGESVEIGGGFRIPDVLAASGATLVDVGTTNRTRAADYEAAAGSRTAAILTVHPSNFLTTGFVARPSADEVAGTARRCGVRFLADLGSGLLDETAPWLAEPPRWLAGEPGARQVLAAGADLVFFSGDKLLGGPQAGIAAGRSALVDQLRRHPLARALRIDKHRLSLLQDTLLAYLADDVTARIPFWRMAVCDTADRAKGVADAIGARTEPGESLVGAGSAPGNGIPTTLVVWPVPYPDRVTARLRAGDPPVVARVEGDAVVIDVRTVEPDDDEVLIDCLRSAVA